VGLGQLCRRHPELPLEGAAKVPVAYTEFMGQVRYAPAIECARCDAQCCRVGHSRNCVAQCSAWGKLRPAPETRPEAVSLGSRSRFEEPAALRIGDSSRADRPAVDHRGPYADEEDSVEPRIARSQRASADRGVEHRALGS
jgi:hypothetical protein